jgi:hypothetical protein
LAPSLTIPVGDGRLLLGTWQGIYLGEHRDSAAAAAWWPPCSASEKPQAATELR